MYHNYNTNHTGKSKSCFQDGLHYKLGAPEVS